YDTYSPLFSIYIFADVGSGQYEPLYPNQGQGYPQQAPPPPQQHHHQQQAPYYGATGQYSAAQIMMCTPLGYICPSATTSSSSSFVSSLTRDVDIYSFLFRDSRP